MPAEGLGPEIAAAHVAVTASFRGMAASVQREAQAAGRTLGTTLTSNASSGARSAGSKAGSEFSGGFSEKVSAAFKNVFLYGGAYTAINGIQRALGAAADSVIGFNSKLEQSDIAFKGLLGSSQAAEKEMSWIKDFAKATPFNFGDLLTDDQQLIAMGSSAKEAHEQLKAIGDAAAGLGRGKDEINRMVLALGQMQSKGRIQSQELLQLQEAGIPALKYLAKAYNATTDDMQKAISKGLIKSDQAVPVLVKQIEAHFKGQMANQSKTLAGTISNIEDTLQQELAQAGKGAFDEVNKAAHQFLDYLNSPAGKKTIEDIGRAFTDAAKGAEYLGKHLWDLKEPLIALGAGYVALKAGESILVRGAGATGSLMKALQGAGEQSSIAAKMNAAYRESLGQIATEADVAVAAINRVAAAQVAQAEKSAAGGKITAETSAFNSLPTYYGAQRGGSQAQTYKQAQAAMEEASGSATKLSGSIAGVGRAAASAAPLIGAGTLALTSLTGVAKTGAGQMANFAATGALVGSAAGPWGVAIGALTGIFGQQALAVKSAKDALDSIATSTSWDQLDARFEQSSTHLTSWWKQGLKIAEWVPGIQVAARALDNLTGSTENVEQKLKDAGTSLSEAEAAAKAGGAAWRSYRSETLAAADGDAEVKQRLDDLAAGARNTRQALNALAESNFATTGATYKTADAFIAAAKQAGLTAQDINIMSTAARSVPGGAYIQFGTNALDVLQQIEALKTALNAPDDKWKDLYGTAPAEDQLKKLQKQLTTSMTYKPAGAGAPLSLPPIGGAKKPKGAKKAKKAYSVDIFDPFTDTGWEQLTGGKIAADLKKMQDQADKAFAAMKKGSMSFSRTMKDLAHGKELKKAFKDMKKDASDAITSLQGQIKDLDKDMVQMGKDLASAINPADFGMDVTGATDFFGNPIKGSTEAAYKAQLQQQGANLSGELADVNTLSGWGLSGDYLSQLLQSNNKTLLDELVQGGQGQALQIFNMTKSNDSIAQQIGAQTAAQTTAYAADRAEAASLQKKIDVLADFVTQIKKDDKDGKLSKKELTKIAKYGDEVKKAFKAVVG
jgi:tape measure domain-containing protein